MSNRRTLGGIYLGDAVYASYDGYGIELTTGHPNYAWADDLEAAIAAAVTPNANVTGLAPAQEEQK